MHRHSTAYEQAEKKYKLADDNYQVWKERNPRVDAWTDQTGRKLAEERDAAAAQLDEADRK